MSLSNHNTPNIIVFLIRTPHIKTQVRKDARAFIYSPKIFLKHNAGNSRASLSISTLSKHNPQAKPLILLKSDFYYNQNTTLSRTSLVLTIIFTLTFKHNSYQSTGSALSINLNSILPLGLSLKSLPSTRALKYPCII